jgi:rubrerythrin
MNRILTLALAATAAVATSCTKSPTEPQTRARVADSNGPAGAGSPTGPGPMQPGMQGMGQGRGMMGRGRMGEGRMGRPPTLQSGTMMGPPAGAGPMGRGAGWTCAMSTGPLAADARAAVERALADERRAEALYAALEEKLDVSPTPIPRVVRAEQRHSSELERILVAHALPIPAGPAPTAPSAATPKDACALGVSSERANIAMYDELLAKPLPADVQCVFQHLRAASHDRHLPAFERCAQ